MGVVRITKSVTAVLNVFEKRHQALSVVNLVEDLQKDMNKTTVYRILDRLEDQGTLHSFIGKDGLLWYAKCSSCCSSSNHDDLHPHFQCTECGKTECLNLDITIPVIPNHKIDTAKFLLVGECDDCLS